LSPTGKPGDKEWSRSANESGEFIKISNSRIKNTKLILILQRIKELSYELNNTYRLVKDQMKCLKKKNVNMMQKDGLMHRRLSFLQLVR